MDLQVTVVVFAPMVLLAIIAKHLWLAQQERMEFAA